MKSSERREERERAEATLAIVDAALEAGHPIGERDDRERELGQIALTLRAGAPQPSAGFAADLEERVWAGFEEDRPEGSASSDRRERSSRRPAKRWLRPLDRTAAGAVAAAAVALVVAVGLLSAGGNGTREGTVPQFSGGGSAAPRTAPEEGLEPYSGESDVQDQVLSDDAAAPEKAGPYPASPPARPSVASSAPPPSPSPPPRTASTRSQRASSPPPRATAATSSAPRPSPARTRPPAAASTCACRSTSCAPRSPSSPPSGPCAPRVRPATT